jgi:hypothetical protein
LAELAKNAATASQTASSMREMTTAGIVGSLPSSFEAIPLPGPDATSTPILEEQATQSSSTSFCMHSNLRRKKKHLYWHFKPQFRTQLRDKFKQLSIM